MMFFLWFHIQNTWVTINNMHLKAHHSPCGKTCVCCCRSCLPVGRPSGSRVFNCGRHGRIWTCLFHLWGAEIGGLFMAEKCGELWGCWNTIFTQFDFSEFQWSTKNIGKHTMKVQMMYDVWWIFASMEPRCILRNDAYYDLWHIHMTYWNVFDGNYAWELVHLGLHLNLGWMMRRFFSSHMSTQPFCESLILECKLTTFFSVVSNGYHYHYHLIVNSTIVTSNISYTYSTCFCNILLNIIYPFQSFCDES